MTASPQDHPIIFEPTRFHTFRFVSRHLDLRGHVSLQYALDDELSFVEEFDLPVGSTGITPADAARVDGLLSLLHWVAGVSYFKTSAPREVLCETDVPLPATAAYLEALYSEGLGEFAYTNDLPELPRPKFPRAVVSPTPRGSVRDPVHVLVPIGGGKDSVVALETIRRSGRDIALFSVGDIGPIARTAAIAGLPHLVVRRRLDPRLVAVNRAGALNGHIPITAIVSSVALLVAALHGFDTVAMANERSASRGSVTWNGIEVNHQFSKGLRAERLLQAALTELTSDVRLFSVLRPASELAIARAFARFDQYHDAFTSCNAVFRMDSSVRSSSWCCNCPKCRFVFLMLAPFVGPAHLRDVIGADLLDDDHQYTGFAQLVGVEGHKPFECVGEEEESVAAIRLIADDPKWSEHSVVRRLVEEALSQVGAAAGDPLEVLALSDDHEVPASLLPDVHAILGS